MKVSVVIATYNGEKYIEDQLNSIMNQSRKVDELVIIDDDSTDNTFNVIDDFIKNNCLINWFLVRNKENLGFIKNFRKGIKVSSGDVIFLCDQDDIWELNKVKEIENILVNENIKLVASTFLLIDKDGKVIDDEKQTFYSEGKLTSELTKIDMKGLLNNNFAQGCSMAVKRSVIDEYLLYPNESLEHDWSLSLLASATGGCYLYNKQLFRYRIHDKNVIGVKNTLPSTKKDRVEQRVFFINEELKRVDFLLQYELNKELFDMLYKTKRFIEFRIDHIENRKLIPFIIKSLFSTKNQYLNVRRFLGDITAIIK